MEKSFINNKIEFTKKFNTLNSSKGFYLYKKKRISNKKMYFFNCVNQNLKNGKFNNLSFNSYKKIDSINLKLIKTILVHSNYITSMSIFPSGELISVSWDKSINIYDINFNILQHIENAHENNIINKVDIKDEKNFVTISPYQIRIWVKQKNKFIINQIIKNPHQEIKDIKFCLNGNLISNGFEKIIKIWEKSNNIYQNILIINYNIDYFFLLNEKHYLITSSKKEIRFLNLKNYECIFFMKEIYNNFFIDNINKIDDDKIIIQGYNDNEKSIKIFSILKMKIVNSIINNDNSIFLISFQDKGIFFIGNNKYLNIYNIQNYQLIIKIPHHHIEKYGINGIIDLKNGLIVSYSNDNTMNMWSFTN